MQGFLGKGIDGVAAPTATASAHGPQPAGPHGPDGKIVAKGMRNEEIEESVARALKKP